MGPTILSTEEQGGTVYHLWCPCRGRWISADWPQPLYALCPSAVYRGVL